MSCQPEQTAPTTEPPETHSGGIANSTAELHGVLVFALRTIPTSRNVLSVEVEAVLSLLTAGFVPSEDVE